MLQVDTVISSKSNDDIIRLIDSNQRVKAVVKLPNSSHLLKFIFESADTADWVVREGLTVHFQRFERGNIEKKMFVPFIPCYKCHS